MEWNHIEGNWDKLKGKFKEKWGKLTDDDLTAVGGKKDQLVGSLKKSYGMQKEEAERQLEEFSTKLEKDSIQ